MARWEPNASGRLTEAAMELFAERGYGKTTVLDIAARAGFTPAQVVFAFARAVGMLPLTGTSSAEHMRQDLASRSLTLPVDAVRAIEGLAG